MKIIYEAETNIIADALSEFFFNNKDIMINIFNHLSYKSIPLCYGILNTPYMIHYNGFQLCFLKSKFIIDFDEKDPYRTYYFNREFNSTESFDELFNSLDENTKARFLFNLDLFI